GPPPGIGIRTECGESLIGQFRRIWLRPESIHPARSPNIWFAHPPPGDEATADSSSASQTLTSVSAQTASPDANSAMPAKSTIGRARLSDRLHQAVRMEFGPTTP